MYNFKRDDYNRYVVIYMIISYSFKNFRSFKKETTLNLKASAQTTFNENLIRKKGIRILPSAVIYGANASGKSSIITSLNVFRSIVISGSLVSSDKELQNLEIYPFAYDKDITPMSFDIDFISNNYRMRYYLSISIEPFSERGKRTVEYEQLDLIEKNNTTNLYIRKNNNVTISENEKARKILKINDDLFSPMMNKLNENLDPVELFLARGFKNFINSELADTVIDFFQDIYVVTDFTLRSTSVRITSSDRITPDFSIWNDLLEGFVKSADFGPQKIRFMSKESKDEHSANMELRSIYHYNDKNISIPAELTESRGTIKLIDFAIAFQTFFNKGGTFIIDEFDAALHPEMVKGILSVFNNIEINKEGAQLVFSTHNPIFLNNRIFRRDQILFVEKDKNSYQSALYSLSDFGSKNVRNDENYLINYFKGKYSALPYIDFSKVLKKEDNNNV